MELQIVVPLFLVRAVIFLVIYGVMKSLEQEERERQQAELERCAGSSSAGMSSTGTRRHNPH